MKKILLIFVILGALASVAGCILGLSASEVLASPNRINGSGNLIDRTIPAPDFETVSSACGVTVLITDDNTDRIRIEADDNLMEYVVVEERQGTLRVALDQGRKGARSVSNAHVTVTVPSNGKIRALKASSASQIVCRTALGADDFSIETSSAAKVEAAVKAGKCSTRRALRRSSPPSTSRSAAQTRRAPRRSPFRAKPPNSVPTSARPPSFRPTNSTPRRARSTPRAAPKPRCTAPERSAPTPRAVRRSVTRATARPT